MHWTCAPTDCQSPSAKEVNFLQPVTEHLQELKTEKTETKTKNTVNIISLILHQQAKHAGRHALSVTVLNKADARAATDLLCHVHV